MHPEKISGLQIWLNLPAREKMTRPKYRDLRADHLEDHATDDGARVRVIAGESNGIEGPVGGLSVAPKFVDVVLPPGAVFREDISAGHTAFVYLDRGRVGFGVRDHAQFVEGPALVVLGDGDFIRAEAERGGGRFLLAAAKPLDEPIARYGPFVMNTPEEIQQTLADLRSGHFIREEAADL